MSNHSLAIVSKDWNYAHVLKNAGVGYGGYVKQFAYLLFLKLTDKMTELAGGLLLAARYESNLDIFWLKDESLEDSENLPPPAELAVEIVESLEEALEELCGVAEALTTTDTES